MTNALQRSRDWASGVRPGGASAAVSQPIHRERVIAGCRVALSSLSLLATRLVPTAGARPDRLGDLLLAGYAVFALVLASWLWSARTSPRLLPLVVHAVDMALCLVILLVTAGPASPFFAFLVFAVAAATVRWQGRGALWTGVAALLGFAVVGLLSATRQPVPFAVDSFLIRSIYLGVVAVLLASIGHAESRLRARVAGLGEWPAVVPTDVRGTLGALLAHASTLLGAPRALLVWEEPGDPRANVAAWAGGNLLWQRQDRAGLPLAPAELAEQAFSVDAGRESDRPVRLITVRGRRTIDGDPIPADLRGALGGGAVLSVPLSGETLNGRFFAAGGPSMTADELVLGEILARQIALQMDRLVLFERFHRAGLAEERVRFASDLHDGVIQSLAGAALRLESARQLVAQEPAAAVRSIEEIQELLISEQRELREFIDELALDDTRPRAAPSLEDRLQRLRERIALLWDLRVDLALRLPDHPLRDGLAQQVYGLVHEALVNASRHGRASEARVEITIDDAWAHVTVSDDGKGFPFRGEYDFAALVAMKLGPVSLKRRVTTLGGQLEIRSSDEGARIAIRLPLQPAWV